MASPTVTMRCPSCGTELRAVLAPSPPTQWFPCPSCHVPVPVVVPSDLPPLYSWEVIPGLYTPLPAPRRPRWRSTRVASVALAVAAVLAGVSAGVLGYDGYTAAQPATYAVSGTVYEDQRNGVTVPAAGALVVLYSDGNRSFSSEVTRTDGKFAFDAVPNGGIELNVTLRGYGPTDVFTFASRSYSTQTGELVVTLEPGGVNNTSADVLTPFADLEMLLAYVGGASALFGGVAAVAAVAAVAVRRPGGGVMGVIGGGAAVAVPAVLVFLALGSAFPLVTVVAGVVGGAGAFTLVLATVEVATHGHAAGPA